MKASKFSEAQIAFVLKQAEAGSAVAEVCRKAGISEATRLVPLADQGYWLAVTSIPSRWAASTLAMIAGASPCTSTPSALMCEIWIGICASRPIVMASSIEGYTYEFHRQVDYRDVSRK